MNGRIKGENTPEGRLAAVAASVLIYFEDQYIKTHQGPSKPDYADFREAFRLQLKSEELAIRIDEARKDRTTPRILELAKIKSEVDREIEKEKRW